MLKSDTLRIAVIAILAVVIAKVVFPKIPLLNGLAAYL